MYGADGKLERKDKDDENKKVENITIYLIWDFVSHLEWYRLTLYYMDKSFKR